MQADQAWPGPGVREGVQEAAGVSCTASVALDDRFPYTLGRDTAGGGPAWSVQEARGMDKGKSHLTSSGP